MKKILLNIATLVTLSGAVQAQFVSTAGTQLTPSTAWIGFGPSTLQTHYGITWDATGGDGYGVVATGLDLGVILGDLSGITMDVTIADLSGNGTGVFTTANDHIGNVSITMDFSELVDARRLLKQIYLLGESESLTGVDYYYFEDDVTPNLTFSGGLVGGDPWINNTGTAVQTSNSADSVAEAYGVTSITSSHTHSGGATNFWEFQIAGSSIPEPSSAALLGAGGLLMILHRRRC